MTLSHLFFCTTENGGTNFFGGTNTIIHKYLYNIHTSSIWDFYPEQDSRPVN